MIIFYEDEKDTIDEEIKLFISEGYEVKCFDKANMLLELYKTEYNNIKAIIIDIMIFGPGNDFDDDNDSGFTSGLSLLNTLSGIEQTKSNENIPLKIIYTNRNKIELIDKLKKDKRVRKVYKKNEQYYDEFVNEVLTLIN